MACMLRPRYPTKAVAYLRSSWRTCFTSLPFLPADPPVIIISGYRRDETIAGALELGAADRVLSVRAG